MARIRTIKPEFWTSEQVMECSLGARLLFIGLWNFCDDEGRHPLAPKQIKALIFPADDMPISDIERMLVELSTNGLIKTYSVEDREYFYIPGWRHQKIDRPQAAKYPEPIVDHSTNVRDGREGKGREVDTGANAPDAVASHSPPGRILNSPLEPEPADASPDPDPRAKLFQSGRETLERITGKTPDSCRSLIGRWLREVDDEAIHVVAAIEDAARNRVADPVAWITGTLRSAVKSRGPPTVYRGRNGEKSKRTPTDVINEMLDNTRRNGDTRSENPTRMLPDWRGE